MCVCVCVLEQQKGRKNEEDVMRVNSTRFDWCYVLRPSRMGIDKKRLVFECMSSEVSISMEIALFFLYPIHSPRSRSPADFGSTENVTVLHISSKICECNCICVNERRFLLCVLRQQTTLGLPGSLIIIFIGN